MVTIRSTATYRWRSFHGSIDTRTGKEDLGEAHDGSTSLHACGGVYSNDEIFDSTNSGDDRIYDFNDRDYTGSYSAQQPVATIPSSTLEELGQNYAYSSSLEIMNARFVDSNEDNTLNRNETAKVIFEIRNNGAHTLYDVVPTVIETTGNKHIFISPSVHVESIAPGHVIRYTAMVKADNRLKNGTACFCVSVIQGSKTISKVNQFDIPTKSRHRLFLPGVLSVPFPDTDLPSFGFRKVRSPAVAQTFLFAVFSDESVPDRTSPFPPAVFPVSPAPVHLSVSVNISAYTP